MKRLKNVFLGNYHASDELSFPIWGAQVFCKLEKVDCFSTKGFLYDIKKISEAKNLTSKGIIKQSSVCL